MILSPETRDVNFRHKREAVAPAGVRKERLF